ncbi:MAG: hypothetical protein LBU26_07205, partial [Synergistaceae bacterium]|nr:hypothetical protein [Synergistaceae bacterium]
MAEQNNSNYFVPDFGESGSGKAKKVKNHPRSARIIWIITGALAVVMGIIVFSMDSGSRTDDTQASARHTAPPAAAEVKPAVGPFSDSEAVREIIYRNMREQVLLEAAASSDSMILAAPIIEPAVPRRNVRVVVKPPSEALMASRQMASAAFTSAPGVQIAGMVTANPQAETGGSQDGVTGDTLGELMTSYEEALGNAQGTSGTGETGAAISGAGGAGAAIAQGRDAAADSNASAMAHQDRANAYAAANTNTGAPQSEYLSSTRRAPVSKYELSAGSIISGVMVGGINSDLPGTILGQVTQNVYDTATGAHLLIPQGARMVGAYDSHVVYGQSRLLVVWNRIIFPDGTS